MTRSRIPMLGALASGIPVCAAPLGAQTAGWSGSAEASANVLYGAARGRVAAVSLGVARADSALEVRADARWTYADARDADGDASVTARALHATLAVDRRPFARVSPFAFGAAETSYQQRIAARVSGGAGTKFTFSRHGDDDVSLSLALLAERTRVLDPDVDTPAANGRARWSWRGRVRRQLTESLQLTHVTLYQPAVDRPGRYTVDSSSTLAAVVTRALTVTATLHERYDSEARSRGARSGHDGQLLFGVRATF